ncbi:MAG: stress responsive protein [Bacteroidetes bacterium HGW-Bacteroidetes-6]|jgi:hypothetical protein|nr:MAG: stress responsive protein [Bacteroidetes bacterium HGW-Bacteroidetes-6]
MVRHIVLWKFHEQAAGNCKEANLTEARRRLLSMEGKIPGMLSIECGINITNEAAAYDLALFCTFDSEESLKIYQTHPVHEEVKKFIAQVRDLRALVDYWL